jgi:DEAD/DEAH box helicase domain-containing protein
VGAERGGLLLKRVLAGVPAGENPLTHVAELPQRSATFVPWPQWTPTRVADAFARCGVAEPWAHQAEAADHAHAGRSVVIATGTASGKSLAYQLPVTAALTAEPRATALYLSPTKALGADQLRSVRELDLSELRACAYDGDTPMAERDWARAHGRWIFTNPDMLHRGVLPSHGRWATFFRHLRYVVIDECHTYRGVFGSHVALLLRRLRRIANKYGADPVFVLASATVADPAASATRLSGVDCVAVTEDRSPRGARTVALWEPPLLENLSGENGAPVRRSAGAETARIMADLVIEGARTLAFVRSRLGAELTAMGARRILSEVDSELVDRVAAYRAGFLPEERRALEKSLANGDLLGVASTNALELGVDIAGLDAVVVAGYPGTLASFWQQAGRAGRAGDGSLVVFVARDDPLDTYLVHNPSAVLDKPIEATVTDPGNPYVLAPQLTCAAAELPLTPSCLPRFGAGAQAVVDGLVEDGVLRKRPTGWYWTSRTRPHGDVDIRGSGGEQIAVVETDSGRMLGTVSPGSACTTVHPGAVYLHQGASYVVDELDLDSGLAMVHAENPEWSTQPREIVDIAVLNTLSQQEFGAGVTVCLGEVAVTSQVVAYLRRLPSGEVLDQIPLDLPEHTLTTRAVWYTVSEDLLSGIATIPGALHAAEHAAIGLLPLFATCDRWDIGGVSTSRHPDTGRATVFVHDGHPGGAGFADRGHAALVPWLTATRSVIAACECPAGCPSCVQSPKCGNGNEPLDKAGAIAVLGIVLRAIAG